jgi:hypothetical protein
MNNPACILNEKYEHRSRPPVLKKVRAFFSLRSTAVFTALGAFILIMIPLASVMQPASEIWQHIADTLLLDLLGNTFDLCIGVMAGTVVLGVGSAWLTAVCDFSGRSFFNWSLMLPLARKSVSSRRSMKSFYLSPGRMNPETDSELLEGQRIARSLRYQSGHLVLFVM